MAEENDDVKMDIRGSLSENFSAEDEGISAADTAMMPSDYEEPAEAEAVEAQVVDDSDEQEVEEPELEAPRAVAPPSDMNKAEREAFLNPTADNSHILQGYLSRRSLETRQEYERRRLEIEKIQKETEPLHNAYKKYQDDYKRLGLSPEQIYERSIEWDQAMRKDPKSTALEYLQSYGVSIDDLIEMDMPEPYEPAKQEANYLTKEDAEKIAEERVQKMLSEQQEKEVAVQTLNHVQQFMNTKPLFTSTDAQTAAQLEDRMAPVVQALNAQGGRSSQDILETAYNYVVKGDPMFAELERKLTATKDIKAQQAVTAKAKAASKTISGSVGSASPQVKVKDIRENLRRRLNGL